MCLNLRGDHHNYSLKFVPCVHLSFLIFAPSELISANTKNLILMNYKIKKKKINHIYSIKITIGSILLKIRKKNDHK